MDLLEYQGKQLFARRGVPVPQGAPATTVEEAVAAADAILLDNMDVPTMRQAVALVAGRAPTEASGGVRLDTIGAIAATGVDFVSVGRLTQSAPAADIGLDFTPV